MRRIIDSAYKDAEQLLKDHRDQLDRVAEALLEMETLDADEFEAIYSGTKTVEELQTADSEKAAARKVVEDAEAKARAEKEAAEAAEAEARANAGKRVAILDTNGNVKRIVTGGIRRLDGEKVVYRAEGDPEKVVVKAAEEAEKAAEKAADEAEKAAEKNAEEAEKASENSEDEEK